MVFCFFLFWEGSDKLAERGRIYHNFYTPELWEQVNKENKRKCKTEDADFVKKFGQR